MFKASRGIEDIYELTYFRKDGSRFPAIVSVTALRDAQENIIGYLLIGTDNTARKEVEAAQALLDQRLRDQQFYTRSLIESNIDALMTTDPQGIISDVNQQMIALTGRTRDELIGAPCKNFFTDPARADAAIKRVLTENKVSNYELTVRALNGEETVVSYNAATFHNRDRKLQGVFAAARDVTELQALRAHPAGKEHRAGARQPHEVGVPGHHVARTAHAAERHHRLFRGAQGRPDRRDERHPARIHRRHLHQRAAPAVADQRHPRPVEGRGRHDGARAGGGRPEEPAVEQPVDRQGKGGGPAHLASSSKPTTTWACPQLDMRKTKQIVYNLLSNAVKFSANGGRVTLRARRVPRSSRRHACRAPGRCTAFPWPTTSTANSSKSASATAASAFPSENMAKLFQAFSQIDSSLARKFEGTGLGLAMVKQLAELHGGTVAVASAEGEGALLRRLVAAAQRTRYASRDARRPAASAATVRRPSRKERIALVVEDDDQAADLVRLLLEAEGFTVLRAASAEAALADGAAADAQPDHAGHPAAGHRRLGVPAAHAREQSPWPACRW